MPVTVTINKSEYTFPSAGDAPGWGEAATTVIQALAANKLDKSAFWKDADPVGYQILDDDGYMVIGISSEMASVKLPEAAKNPGRIIYVYKISGYNTPPNVGVKPGSGDSIVGSTEGSCLGFVSDGTSSWITFLKNTILVPQFGSHMPDNSSCGVKASWVYDNLTDSGTVKPFVQRAAIETRTNTNGQIADTAADKTVILVHTDGGPPMSTVLPEAANNGKVRLTIIRDPSSTSTTLLSCQVGNTFGDGSTDSFDASVSGGAWTFESDGVSKWICVSSHDGTLP